MNILYFHDQLLRDTYPCGQVRQRLSHYIKDKSIDRIYISVSADHLDNKLINLIKDTCNCMVVLSTDPKTEDLIIVSEQMISLQSIDYLPQEGSVLLIETMPTHKATYIFFDLFADESFADWHSDFESDAQIIELSELLNPNKHTS
jgi:hypothetical protein